MTVTLYAYMSIYHALIESGVRTWSDARLEWGKKDVLMVGMDVAEDITTIVGPFRPQFHRFAFTFADEPAAMAFRLRYSDYLVDRPRHPDCDALMALEAV